jgi:hypothetical protein
MAKGSEAEEKEEGIVASVELYCCYPQCIFAFANSFQFRVTVWLQYNTYVVVEMRT